MGGHTILGMDGDNQHLGVEEETASDCCRGVRNHLAAITEQRHGDMYRTGRGTW